VGLPAGKGERLFSPNHFLSSLLSSSLIYSVARCQFVGGPFPVSFITVQMSVMRQGTRMFDSCPINYAEEQVKDNCSGLLKQQLCSQLKNFL
jgi:hypothetical protein